MVGDVDQVSTVSPLGVFSQPMSRRSHHDAEKGEGAQARARRSSFELDERRKSRDDRSAVGEERRKSGPLVLYSDFKAPALKSPSPPRKASSPKDGRKTTLDVDKSPSRLSACPSSSTTFSLPMPDTDQSIRMQDSLSEKMKFDDREVYDIRSLLFLLLVTAVLGSIIGVVGGVFHKVVFYTRENLRGAIGAPLHDQSPYLMYSMMTLACVLSAVTVGVITQKMCPECIGGGMIATRICVSLGAPLRFEVVVYRFALSSLYMGGGNPLGAEAPTLHICAALAGSINGFFSRIFPSLLNMETMPQIVLIGCVAGISQAFHTPLGALIFALEEFDFVRRSHVTFVLISACAVPATLVSTGVKGLLSAGGNAALFSIPPPRDLDKIRYWMLFTLSTSIGIVMALAAEVFNRLVIRSRGKMETFVHSPNGSAILRSSLIVACVSIIVGVSGVIIIDVLAKIVGIKCDAFKSACPDSWGVGEMTMTALSRFLAFSAYPESTIKEMGDCNLYGEKSYWFHPTEWDQPEFGTAVRGTFIGMMLVGAIKLVIVALAAAAGGSGGMFAPALTLGGLLGGGFGIMLCYVLEFLNAIDNFNLQVLGQVAFFFGMVGFFTGTHRLPLTAAICVFELTSYAESENCLRMPANTLVTCILFPCLWTSVVSFSLSLYFDPDSLLERMIEQDGFSRDDLSDADDTVSSFGDYGIRASPSPNISSTSFASHAGLISRNSSFADAGYNSRKQSALQGVARAQAEFASNNPSLLNKILSHAKQQQKRTSTESRATHLPNMPEREGSVEPRTEDSFICNSRPNVEGYCIDEEKDEWACSMDDMPSRHGSMFDPSMEPGSPGLPNGWCGGPGMHKSSVNNVLKGKKFIQADSKRLKSVGSNSNTSTMRMYRNAVQNRKAPGHTHSRSNSVSGFPQDDMTLNIAGEAAFQFPKTSRSLNACTQEAFMNVIPLAARKDDASGSLGSTVSFAQNLADAEAGTAMRHNME